MNYPLKFKAAILEANHQPLVIDEVTFEGLLERGQVLVRIYYSGICGKQIEEIEGSRGADPYLPHMLGHEGSGIVVDIGPGVSKVAPGDYVVLHWVKGSGIDGPTPIYKRSGKRVNAGWITTFNEYGVISENRITPIPKESDLSIACLLGCAVTTGVGVVLNEAKLQPGESVAVFGCGGVGLCAIQGAVLAHGRPIIAVDKNSRSLELALKFGASHTINADKNDIPAEIRQITGGEGARLVVVAVGDPKVIETAVQASSIPGSVFLVGVPPAGSKISVDAFDIHRQRMLTGSYGGGVMPDRDIPSYLALYENGTIRLKELISNTVTLNDINEGIRLIKSGESFGRCIVKMPGN